MHMCVGVKIVSQGSPGLCFDNLGVQAATLRFYTKVAQIAVNYAGGSYITCPLFFTLFDTLYVCMLV
jgi:hypothetical protein